MRLKLSAGKKPLVLLFLWACWLHEKPLAAAGLEVAPTVSNWNKLINLRSGIGFKDNLLYSNVQKEQSGFYLGSMDIFVWRFPTNGSHVSFFLNGDDYRYFSSGEVEKEQFVLSQAELKREFGENWEWGLAVQNIYLDQFLDASNYDTNLITQVQGHGFTFLPSLRKKLSQQLRMELKWELIRQYFREPLDDYWEGGPRILFGWEYGHKSEINLAFEIHRRSHDHRAKLDNDGLSIEGATLSFEQREVELAWLHHWDAKKRWRTVSTLGLDKNQDNGSGIYNYERRKFSQQLRFQTDEWFVKTQASLQQYVYEFQSVSETDFLTRKRKGILFNLRCEKNLNESWKLFAEFEHERSLSNQPLDRYRVNMVSSGVDFEF